MRFCAVCWWQALAGGNTFVGGGNVGFHGVQYVTIGLTFSQVWT